MTYTRDLIRTIGRNAGKVPKHTMANSLGISVSFLERIARDNGYDLRLIAERGADPDPNVVTSAAHPTPRVRRQLLPLSQTRTEQIGTHLTARDVLALDTVGASLGLPRARVVSRIIENARARDLLYELAKLPAPKPQKEEGA